MLKKISIQTESASTGTMRNREILVPLAFRLRMRSISMTTAAVTATAAQQTAAALERITPFFHAISGSCADTIFPAQ